MRILLDEMSRSHEALVEGADPADMDHGDGIWRSNADLDRAADPSIFDDHVRLLARGGDLEDVSGDALDIE